MIQPIEARELCSESEWALVESSFSPTVESLSPSDLKSKRGRVRKLHEESSNLDDRQHSDARKRTTRRKVQLFAEAIGRFEAALALLESAAQAGDASGSEKLSEETRGLNRKALQIRTDQELESRKAHGRSAKAARVEQQAGKTGSRRIQSHVGSATRRQQRRRDTKNR